MKRRIRNFLIGLNLINERTDAEKFDAVLIELRRKNFLDDIAYIRTVGGYIPNYNPQPKFDDVKIEGISNWMPKTVVARPIEFKKVEDWRESIHMELKKFYQFKQDNQLKLF
jgi:hypothetical protein